jgi:dynein heavy chain
MEKYLPGNSVVAAAMIAYSGPFTSHFRQELETDWVRQMAMNEIFHTE